MNTYSSSGNIVAITYATMSNSSIARAGHDDDPKKRAGLHKLCEEESWTPTKNLETRRPSP